MEHILFLMLYWTSLSSLAHAWVFYGVILFVMARIRGKRTPHPFPDDPPMVSVIIAAKDEERDIRERIEDVHSLRYHREKLEVIVASDGSTDGTNAIVEAMAEQWDWVRLLAFETQRGRAAVHNDAARHSRGEILVFTDAETRFHPDFLMEVIPHFSDPTVGAVSGRVHYVNETESAITRSASLYWRMEEKIRLWESQLGLLAFGSGAAFCVRRTLYCPLEPYEDIDYALSMDIASKGYKVIYEPQAIAFDRISRTASETQKIRVRQTSRAYRSILRRVLRPSLLWRRPGVFFAAISHKTLRHLTPLAMLALLTSNVVLFDNGPFYQGTLCIQALFYLCALFGWLAHISGMKPGILGVPFSFIVLNIGRIWGVMRASLGRPPSAYK